MRGRFGRTLGTLTVVVAAGAGTALLAPGAGAQLPILGTTPTATTGTSGPAGPPPDVVAPGPVADETAQQGVDAAHRGAVTAGGIAPPLRSLWRADFKERVGKPVVGGGRAYVDVGRSIVALDLKTGKQLWTSGDGAGGLAYAENLLVSEGSGGLRAFDAATGTPVWAAANASSGGPPAILGDLVVLQEQGLTAYDLKTGAMRWKGGDGDGTEGSPAAAGDRIYQSGACTTSAVNRLTGAVIWRRNRGCTGGGGGPVTLDGDRVYTRSGFAPAGPLGAPDGADRPGPILDALSGNLGLAFADGGALRGIEVSSGRALWSVKQESTGYDAALGSPLIVGDSVFQGAFAGRLQALGLADGALRYGAALRAPTDIFTGSENGPATLGAGSGVLVVVRGATVDGLAAAGGTLPDSLAVTIPRQRAYDALTTVTVKGKATGNLLPVPRLAVDPFPFGHFAEAGRRGTLDAKGAFALSYRPDRNTRVRVVGAGATAAPTRSFTLFAYPRIRFTVRNVANRISVPTTVKGSKAVRFRGRRLTLYIVRVAKHRLTRLRSAKISGPSRASGHATFRFPALRGLGRKDFLYVCMPGAEKLGMGNARDALQRHCGRASLKY